MVRWINDYIGTAPRDAVEETAETVIVDVRDLVDKSGNTPEAVRLKITEAAEHLKHGKKIIVCCDYGISRSNAVAAGIIKLHENISFDAAIQSVIAATGEKAIKIDVANVVRAAVEDKKAGAADNKPRILITGGSGFLGSALQKHLQGRFDYFAPTSAQFDLERDVVELDGYIKEHRINTVVHLANPRIYTANAAMGPALVMLRNILDLCRENNARLIYPSSWEIYSGHRPDGGILADEDFPAAPKGAYGETKYFSELMIDLYKQNSNITACILRLGTAYGSNNHRPKFLYNFIKKAQNGETITTHRYSNGFPHIDLAYVGDIMSAFETAITHALNETVNIGSACGYSTAEIAQKIITLTGSTSNIEHVEINGYTPNIVLNTKKAENILQWQPKADFYAWLRDEIQATETLPKGSRHAG